jgi:hypothetical protein
MKLISLTLACAAIFSTAAVGAQTPEAAGKNYGTVRVHPASPARGAPGSAVNVQIDYTGLSASGASVTYATEDSLTLNSPASKQLTPDSGGVAHDTVIVQAKSSGVYFLNVFAKAKGVTQAISIPVTIGNAVLKPRAASATARPDGETVIEMPAQQKVQ